MGTHEAVNSAKSLANSIKIPRPVLIAVTAAVSTLTLSSFASAEPYATPLEALVVSEQVGGAEAEGSKRPAPVWGGNGMLPDNAYYGRCRRKHQKAGCYTAGPPRTCVCPNKTN